MPLKFAEWPDFPNLLPAILPKRDISMLYYRLLETSTLRLSLLNRVFLRSHWNAKTPTPVVVDSRDRLEMLHSAETSRGPPCRLSRIKLCKRSVSRLAFSERFWSTVHVSLVAFFWECQSIHCRIQPRYYNLVHLPNGDIMLAFKWTEELLTGGYTRDKIRRTLEKWHGLVLELKRLKPLRPFLVFFASAVEDFIGALGVLDGYSWEHCSWSDITGSKSLEAQSLSGLVT